MWTTQYGPVDNGSVLASAGVVLIPIVVLFVMLFTTRVIYAAWVALLIFIGIAVGVYHMPIDMALIAACNGALYGAWPICLIIFAAIFIFDMCVITGHFETVKYTIVSLTKDKRLLALLLAYAFSGFIEGASGFSTPIALASSMMIGVGFSKRDAAKAALLGNTIPVVFGGIGIPVITLGTVTRLPPSALGIAATRLLIPFSLTMPFVIVYSISNFKQMVEVWPACAFTAVIQTGLSLLIAEYAGAQPVSIVSMICTLACLALFLRVWKPANIVMTESMANEEAGLRTHKEVDLISEGGSPSKARAAAIAAATTTTTAAAEPGTMLTPHLSLRLDRSHPISNAPASGVTASSSNSDLSAGSKTPGGSVPGASPHVSFTPGADNPGALVTQDGHVLLMRRTLITDTAKRALDSSSVATALFPHTLEHEYALQHRVHGKFVRVTRDATTGAGALQTVTTVVSEGSGGASAPTLRAGTSPSAGSASDAAASMNDVEATTGGAAVALNATPRTTTTRVRVPPQSASTGSLDAPSTAAAGSSTSTAAVADVAVEVSDVTGVDATPSTARSDAPLQLAPSPPVTAAAAAPSGNTTSIVEVPEKKKKGEQPEQQQHGGHDAALEHAKEAAGPQAEVAVHYDALHPPSRNEILTAWFPWVLVAVLVVIWGIPPVKGVVGNPNTGLSQATLLISMTGLDGQVAKPDPSGTGAPHIVAATWTLDFVGATGICLFICGFITSGVFRLHPKKTAWILWKSFRRMALPMFTICTLLSLGSVIKFSGMDYTLGLAAARTMQGYPFLAPWIGFLGVVISGSATTSNVLFGSLQIVAADQIGVNHLQMAAANVAGGVLGHVISTSSMMVAAVSTGSDSKNIGPIVRSVILYSLALIVLFSSWNILITYAFPSFIPSASYLS